MNTYRNKITGAVITVKSELGGDWVLVSQSQPKETKKEKPVVKEVKEETEEKPKKQVKRKK